MLRHCVLSTLLLRPAGPLLSSGLLVLPVRIQGLVRLLRCELLWRRPLAAEEAVCVVSALRPKAKGARGLSPGVLAPGRASQRKESPLKGRQIKSNVTDRAPGLIPNIRGHALATFCRSFRADRLLTFKTQGCASLHPGLMSTTPSACSSGVSS